MSNTHPPINPDDWSQIESLFVEAIQLPPEQRMDYVNQKCDSESLTNAELVRTEVESLLANHVDDSTEQMTTRNSSAIRDSLIDVVNRIQRQSLEHVDLNSMMDDVQSRRDEDIARTIESADPDLQLHEILGKGGTGIVYRARQISLGRNVAIKVHANLHADKSARERFVAESRATARVNHKSIVDIFSVHNVSGWAFQVMELIQGPTLKQTLKQSGRLKPTTAAHITRQIADGLSAAHRQSLVHRDVKPANIMFVDAQPDLEGGTASVKLLDFGIVRDLEHGQVTLDQMVVGTPAYMSPEQLLEPDEIDHRTDVYGLGVTLYEMLTGTRPFAGAPHMIINQLETHAPTDPRSHDDRIPKDLESICLKAIHRQPSRRYQSTDEFADDLQRFLDDKPTVARPVTQVERLTSWCRRNRRLAASISGLLLLGLVLLVGSLAFAWVVSAKNRQIVRQQSATLKSRVQGILDSDPGALLAKIEMIGEVDPSALAQLSDAMSDTENDIYRRANSAIALTLMGQPKTELLIDLIDQLAVSPQVCRNLEQAFRTDPQARELIRQSLVPGQAQDQQARRIILLAHLGDWDTWRDAALDRIDPSLRTELIHSFDSWHGNLKELAKSAAPQIKRRWGWTICQALTELDARSISQPARESLVAMLELTRDASGYSTFHFGQLAINHLSNASSELNWDHPDCKTFPDDIHLVRIEPGRTRLGRFDPATNETDYPPHAVTITRGYYIGETEVSVAQFHEFARQRLKERMQTEFANQFLDAGSADSPVRFVSWYDAVAYCNWLSDQHGLEPVYQLQTEPLVVVGNDGSEENYPNWQANQSANGFRLPTEAEWGYALRNDSQTPFHFGNDETLSGEYSVSSSRRRIEPKQVRHLLPNSRGLYGMFGNVWEWSYDRFRSMDGTALIDPQGPEAYLNGMVAHVYLGAGVATSGGNLDCEARGFGPPDVRYDNLGFRLAMNAAESSDPAND